MAQFSLWISLASFVAIADGKRLFFVYHQHGSSTKIFYLQNSFDFFVYNVKYTQLFSFSWYHTLGDSWDNNTVSTTPR